MVRYYTLPLRYIDSPYAELVESKCFAWKGTPYSLSYCTPKVGVDCIHFVAAVLDELYGENHSKNLKSLPADACVHNKAGVMKAGRALFKAYPAMAKVEDNTIEAGDLVVLGPAQEEPTAGHLLIAGACGKLWHAISVGVCFTGYGVSEHEMLVSIYRAGDKEKWLSSCPKN